MDTIYLAIGALSVFLVLAMLVVAVLSMRRTQRIGVLVPIVAALLGAAVLPLFMLASGARLNWLLAVPTLALGLLAGLGAGLVVRLHRRPDGSVLGRPPFWLAAVWLGAWALSLAANLTGSVLFISLALLPLMACTAAQVGLNGTLLIRRLAARPSPAIRFIPHAVTVQPTAAPLPAPPPLPRAPSPAAPGPAQGRYPPPVAPPAVCPACGTPHLPGTSLCRRCGTALVPARVCPSCGSAWNPAAPFCGRCGTRLR